METLLMIPLTVTLIIVALMLIIVFLVFKLTHLRNKMRWWRREAMKLNGKVQKDKNDYLKNKARAWWLRNQS